MRHIWIRRVAVIALFVAATSAAAQSPATADDGTTVSITGPTTIIVGTKEPIRFTVSGRIDTADPTGTDIEWDLEGSSSHCFMFYYGDTTGSASGTFTDHGYATPGDLENDCQGSNVIDVSAFDDSAGSDDVTKTFKLLRAARWESVNAHPEPIHKGGTVTVDGVLQRADWDDGTYHKYTQHTAELQFRTMTGSYATVATVSGPSGTFTKKETQKVSGCWRYVFPGSSTTGPATATGDCVAVS
ncbi:MAG TPA: hypothetical protein VGJ28_10185 [Micromonosporaceae bacterium]